MSAVIFLVLLALCGVMYGDAAVPRKKRYTQVQLETPRMPTKQPCYVKGVWYDHGERTGDPCDRCVCSNGLQMCNRMGCNINGVNISPYSD